MFRSIHGTMNLGSLNASLTSPNYSCAFNRAWFAFVKSISTSSTIFLISSMLYFMPNVIFWATTRSNFKPLILVLQQWWSSPFNSRRIVFFLTSSYTTPYGHLVWTRNDEFALVFYPWTTTPSHSKSWFSNCKDDCTRSSIGPIAPTYICGSFSFLFLHNDSLPTFHIKLTCFFLGSGLNCLCPIDCNRFGLRNATMHKSTMALHC